MAEIYRQKNRLFLFQLNQTSFYQFFSLIKSIYWKQQWEILPLHNISLFKFSIFLLEIFIKILFFHQLTIRFCQKTPMVLPFMKIMHKMNKFFGINYFFHQIKQLENSGHWLLTELAVPVNIFQIASWIMSGLSFIYNLFSSVLLIHWLFDLKLLCQFNKFE